MLSFLNEAVGDRGRLLTDYRMLRAQCRIEAVLVTDRAVLVFGPDRQQTAAAAVDLADFHAGCRDVPVLPVVMVSAQRAIAQHPLPFPGAAPPIICTRLLLPGLLQQVARFPPVPDFDPAGWADAPYRPVPGLLDAACRLYASHGVASLAVVNSDRGDLARTRAAVQAITAGARTTGEKRIAFVTGAPGAGKTLCGLDLAFTPGASAIFLTGNPALMHVLRAALVRDAGARGVAVRAGRQRIEAIVQPLHHFRDHYLQSPDPPPERVLVIDEAQRCWTSEYGHRKTRNRAHPLTGSEPALILDIMARHDGWCAVVCLLGGGQEIHDGEGGLAAWGEALATRPTWRAAAPPSAMYAPEPRQRLRPQPAIKLDAALHLGAPVRAWRAPGVVGWVDAVLANDAATARSFAGPDLPVRLTRSLAALRSALRSENNSRLPRRVGLVASTGARRLRAEGLGGLLWHQDEDAVASWFLETWPDIRSADALEVAGTEFGVQGLELDHVGLCWDTDLVRTPDGNEWQARAFRATAWTLPKAPESLSNRLNAYRVLLTRARRSTIVWIPQGDPADPTRDPARYDDIARFLHDCGAPSLDVAPATNEDAEMPNPVLL